MMFAHHDSRGTAVVSLVSPSQLIGVIVILILVHSQRTCECLKFCGQSGGHDPSLSSSQHPDQPLHRIFSSSQHQHRQHKHNPKAATRQHPTGARLKRSAQLTPVPPASRTQDKFNFWDQLEVLLAGYQMSHQYQDFEQDSQNFRIESPPVHEFDRLGGDQPSLGDDDERAREPRDSETAESSQLLSNRQAQGSSAGASDDNDQAAQVSQQAPVKVIETAVFIDQALDNKFTGLSNGLVELNTLVMAIMNQVQYLFEYSSLHVPIKLKLVLVEHLRESERLIGLPAPNPERGDIDAYLSNFCNWQQSRLEGEKRLWWDHAILLSGLDLYKATPGKNHSGVLGLAWVGGMCKGNYSCTINEASNFESAFVIAHEIGHSLGIMHDGQRNKCDPNSFIMSERTGAGKVHWSKCANSYLNDSIQRGQLKCLDSEQNNQIDSLYDLTKLRAPGQVYTINEQCRLAFGNNYTSYVAQQNPFNAVCRELWCVSGTWAKAAHPALEGSSCGQQDLVCREGKCIRMAPQ